MRSRIKCLDILLKRTVHHRVQERLVAIHSITTGGSFSRPFWNQASDTALLAGVRLFSMARLVTGIEDTGFQLIQEQDSLFLSGLFS